MPNPKCMYKKEYTLLSNWNTLLQNPGPILEYVAEKVDELIKKRNTKEELNTKLEIITDFIDMYNFDCENTILPPPISPFNSKEEYAEYKRKWILREDLALSIGSIYYNLHTIMAKENMGFPIISGNTHIINQEEIYLYALNDYLITILEKEQSRIITTPKKGTSQEIKELRQHEYRGMMLYNWCDIEDKSIIPKKTLHSYSATYIIPTLIESALLLNLRSILFHESVDKLKANPSIQLEQSEKDLINHLLNGNGRMFIGKEVDYLRELSNIFIKYNVLDSKNEDYQQFLVGFSTKRRKLYNRYSVKF